MNKMTYGEVSLRALQYVPGGIEFLQDLGSAISAEDDLYNYLHSSRLHRLSHMLFMVKSIENNLSYMSDDEYLVPSANVIFEIDKFFKKWENNV